MSPKGSHVCLFTVDQSLAATTKCPPHTDRPATQTPASYALDQYAGLRNVRCYAVTRLDLFFGSL